MIYAMLYDAHWIIEATCSRDHRLMRSYKQNRLQSFNGDLAVIYVVRVHMGTWYARLAHTNIKDVFLLVLSAKWSEVENSSPYLLLRSVTTRCSSTNKPCCCSTKLVFRVHWIYSHAKTGAHEHISGWKYISGWQNRASTTSNKRDRRAYRCIAMNVIIAQSSKYKATMHHVRAHKSVLRLG